MAIGLADHSLNLLVGRSALLRTVARSARVVEFAALKNMFIPQAADWPARCGGY